MKALLTLYLLTVTLHGQGQSEKQEITSAFGLSLGEVYDTSKTIALAYNDNDELCYEITPVKPNEAFVRYYVVLTPSSKRIAQIWATGKSLDSSEREMRAQTMVQTLKDKYDASFVYTERDHRAMFTMHKFVNRNAISVVANSREGKGEVLEISYTDAVTARLAVSESTILREDALRKAAKKQDGTGL